MAEKEIVPNLTDEEIKKKKVKVKITLLVVVCMIMVAVMTVALGLLYFDGVDLARKLTEKEGDIAAYQAKVTDLNGALSGAKALADMSKADAEAMKQRIAKIKTNDDLMIRDIELYIKARYRRVPTVVAQTLALTIVATCKEEDVSPELVVGIIEIESQFNPMARNEKSGAIGAMQIMPEWSKKLGLKSVYNLYDIPTNIKSGIKVLKIHINEDAKGDIAKGLYFYVGKDRSYANKVFQAAGKFVVFRSTIDDDEHTVTDDQPLNGKEEKKDEPSETFEQQAQDPKQTD